MCRCDCYEWMVAAAATVAIHTARRTHRCARWTACLSRQARQQQHTKTQDSFAIATGGGRGTPGGVFTLRSARPYSRRTHARQLPFLEYRKTVWTP